jgi:hypothetical protein
VEKILREARVEAFGAKGMSKEKAATSLVFRYENVIEKRGREPLYALLRSQGLFEGLGWGNARHVHAGQGMIIVCSGHSRCS